MAKIVILGSTLYRDRMRILANELRREGNEVKLPAFDDHPEFTELEICAWNREAIRWADEAIFLWDQRSMGTVFDFGMCFALGKRVTIEYLEPKTLGNLMRQYAANNR